MKNIIKNSKALRLIAVCMSAVIALSGCGSSDSSSAADDNSKVNKAGTMRDMTTQELIEDMGLGINLGNTFEATGNWINNGSVSDYETCWGSPVITEEMIKGYKDAGFGAVRVPANWSNLMSEDYTIDPEFDKRIHEVVDWILDNDMYVILNVHHEDWVNVPVFDDATYAEAESKLTSIWTQVAETFKDYDQHLIFEGMNEIHEHGNWNTPKDFGVMKNVNAYNQLFVDAVRATGGRNADRILIASGYNTNINITTDPASGWQLPQDPVKDHMMVSLHYYDPYDVTINSDTQTGVWAWGEKAVKRGDKALDWHTEANTDASMKKLHDTFAAKGIPFFIGEYGAIDKTKENKRNQGYREHWYRYVTKDIKAAGGIPVVWDNGAPNDMLTRLFTQARENIAQEAAQYKAEEPLYLAAIAAGREIVDNVTDGETALEAGGKIKGLRHALTSEKEIRAMLSARIRELGLKWDKEAGAYVSAE